ncbi:MAG TPA: family 43 glycosylhydrolase [Roseiflexaceae bacterium]|nr:family 43 glycosylhydrolase [Roseiflexaceae bacterium]
MRHHLLRSTRRRLWLPVLWTAILLAALLAVPSVSRADNPIVQTIYTADPAALVHNGTVYLYTGHDEDGSTYFTMNEWRVYSSTDMVNWTDHGAPLRASTFSWASGDAWASQAIYRNGRFYWYVTVSAKTGGRAIGVAVSNSPTGPFSDALGRPLVGPNWSYIDPTVFIDDDGQAYMYWGNPGLWYVKLNQDMISYGGSVVQVPLTTSGFGARAGNPDRPTLYEEGPWFYKRNGLYYLIYAAGGVPEYIAYSTSSSPTGPWTYRGVIMPTQGGSFTNHPAVIDFNGSSYFFYHNGALPGGGGFTRSVAVERFSYNANGTIPTINMTASGPPGVGTLNPYVVTQAETMAWASGVETEPSNEGGMQVAYINSGDYIKVKGVNFGTGASSFEARVASATSGGSIELRLGSPTGALVGSCAVQGTGGWQTWTTRSCAVSGAAGVHDLYLRFTGGSGSLFNLNWWRFLSGNSPTPTNTPVPGTIARFKAYNFQTSYIRHQGYRGRIDPNVSPIEDSQFRLVPGLANTGAVSFESVNFPGSFLRRRSNGEVWLDQDDNTAAFRNDATWYRRAGLASSTWSSFESLSAPGQYMRHSNYLLFTATIATATDRSDATFLQE